MNLKPTLLGSVLKLERVPLEVDADLEYVPIGIRSFGKGIFHRVPTKGEELSKLRYFHLKPGRLIVSNIMAWEGAIAVSGNGEAGCVASSRFLSYAPTGDVDLSYLNYFFQSEAGRSLIRGTSTGTVLRNQTLSIKDFEALEVPLPSLDEQRRIAARLDYYFSRLDRMQNLREHSHKLVIAIKESLVGDSLLGSTVRCTVGDVMKLQRRQVNVRDLAIYREIGVRSFGRGIFHKPPISGQALNGKRVFWVEPDDLIFSNVFAWEGAVGVASQAEKGMIGSHRFMTYKVDPEMADLRYLYSYFTSSVGLEIIRRSSPGSAGRNKILGIKSFSQQAIVLPRLAIQKKVARVLDGVRGAASRSSIADEHVSALKTSLLNTAFNGTL
ncbi:restriction endonuclease subunit S [Nonomuraea sp. MCN248]|uniref:Restriction endonuclease subunit S n=1 Tax=Nonomuraea corallina TaxID=2989783 RepID=A0ABT4SJA7_9ACTN|nr:restriction endonuclease subunit S [Nonomuraea corallina]MDA0637302.1 restriction endonuclease subunit S [Nonomuraea corallina]